MLVYKLLGGKEIDFDQIQFDLSDSGNGFKIIYRNGDVRLLTNEQYQDLRRQYLADPTYGTPTTLEEIRSGNSPMRK